MQDDPHCPNFGNEQTLARREQFETRLLEGEARVPTVSQTWIARLFACLHSTKESLESQIHSLLNILQDLGMDTHQFGMISAFQTSEPFIRVVQRKGLLFLLPGVFASGQRLVVDPTTKFQRPIELGALAPGGLAGDT